MSLLKQGERIFLSQRDFLSHGSIFPRRQNSSLLPHSPMTWLLHPGSSFRKVHITPGFHSLLKKLATFSPALKRAARLCPIIPCLSSYKWIGTRSLTLAITMTTWTLTSLFLTTQGTCLYSGPQVSLCPANLHTAQYLVLQLNNNLNFLYPDSSMQKSMASLGLV